MGGINRGINQTRNPQSCSTTLIAQPIGGTDTKDRISRKLILQLIQIASFIKPYK